MNKTYAHVTRCSALPLRWHAARKAALLVAMAAAFWACTACKRSTAAASPRACGCMRCRPGTALAPKQMTGAWALRSRGRRAIISGRNENEGGRPQTGTRVEGEKKNAWGAKPGPAWWPPNRPPNDRINHEGPKTRPAMRTPFGPGPRPKS